ncbi:DUF3817 domain-containing protein [Corynebacterium ulceribovis]|uniref:DUF3817 domain-containing protein n=1 Tax=Corynebacterium ulceribovis TaxID=487732 RepID=UPI00036A9C7D|nr:DUF3817 domain-containing protein [Corynebacterium ulceribovis]
MNSVSPKKLYSTLAKAEMVTWTLLILGMILKYAAGLEWATTVGGSIHGFVFLSYGVTTIFVWINQRWPLKTGLLGLFSTIIPYCTVPFERSVEKKGILEGEWRFREGGDTPETFVEKAMAWVLRNPILAVVIALVGIAVVFGILVTMGPPNTWGRFFE